MSNTNPSTPASPPSPRTARPALILALGVFAALALRQFCFVDRHVVNMMFFDQWDFYYPIFNGGSWWDLFRHQHGAHRQGIGFLVTRLLADLSGWNSRWDAFAVFFAIFGAALCGVLVAVRSGVKVAWALVGVGFVFFNMRQHEIFMNAANICLGGFPLLLLTACCCCWFIASPVVRLPLIGALTFLLIFSGYGLFAGAVIPCVIVVECVQAWCARERARACLATFSLLIIAAGWLLFSRGYVFQAAVEDFRFPHERPVEYAWFTGLMLSNLHGFKSHAPGAIALGLVVCAGLLSICAWHGWRMLRRGVDRERASAVIFILAAFTLLYCVNVSIGRVSLGLKVAPLVSRYVTLMIPATFAIFLHLATRPGRRGAWAAGIYIVLLATGTLTLRKSDWKSIRWFHDGLSKWKAAYIETHDELAANQRAKFKVYPDPGAIAGRLRFLEENRLNLFAPDESGR